MYGMRKTTVYLDDEVAGGLQQMAATTGKSQAELIREGLRRLVSRKPARRFYSMGKGHGPGGETPRWDSATLYSKAFGGH